MTINLQPEQERLVAQAIQSGAYANPDQVIARALELLRSEDCWLLQDKDAIHDKIERAFGQFERGECFTEEQSRADMEQRKAAWFADQKRG